MAASVGTAALLGMLEAREARWRRRLELRKDCAALLTVTLCIPLPYRVTDGWKRLLRKKSAEIKKALSAEGYMLLDAGETDGADGLALYMQSPDDGTALKRSCVRLEETLSGGRLLDIDIMAQAPVGRRELGLPPRCCFVCDRPAAECVASGRHPPEELARFVEESYARLR